jgi:hypothetical protein
VELALGQLVSIQVDLEILLQLLHRKEILVEQD